MSYNLKSNRSGFMPSEHVSPKKPLNPNRNNQGYLVINEYADQMSKRRKKSNSIIPSSSFNVPDVKLSSEEFNLKNINSTKANPQETIRTKT